MPVINLPKPSKSKVYVVLANNTISVRQLLTGVKKPKFLCVISGMIDYAYKRVDGVYVVPITALKP